MDETVNFWYIELHADAEIDEDSLVFMETSKGVVEATDSVVSM